MWAVFERYTEEARRSIFFARYAASLLGATEIETEHLLLGILKADRRIAQYLLPFHLTAETIRDKIAKHHPAPKAQISTSVNLPFSTPLKRTLAYGAEESERFGHPGIGPEFLLLGLVREESFLAARILSDAGITDAKLRELAGDETKKAAPPKQQPAQDSEGFRDLTQLAIDGNLTPLIGRDLELRCAARTLSRRTRNSVALIGDPGVGKTALIEGLTQYFSSGAVRQFA